MDFARLELNIDSKGAVTGKNALDNLAASAQKTQTSTRGVMSTFRDLQAIMQGPIAAFQMAKAAITGAFNAMDELITVGAAAQNSLTNFESVLAATGGVAGVTRKELNALIDDLAGSTLFDDEDVRDAQTALMRFRTVSGETFKEAIRLSADLAQVGGGSMEQYAEALGKAFKGQEEGLTMLKRAGIIFTEEQENMATAMYAAGDAAGAQNLILAELTNQLGGAATAATGTATGAFSEMKESIDDMRESFGLLVGQIAQQSGLTGWIKGMASRMNDVAMITEGKVRWKTGGLTASDIDMLIGALGRELARLKKEAEEWGWTQYLPGTGSNGKLFGAQSGGGGYKDQIKELENFRGALLTLQAQYDALEKSAAKANDTTSNTPPPDSKILGYSTSYQYESANLEHIDIINAVIEKQLEEKALREESAESVAAYWADYISGCQRAAEAEEALAEAAKKAREQKLGEILRGLQTDLENLLSSGLGDAYLGIMNGLGSALAGSATAGQDMAEMLADLGARILNELPRLLLYAGIQAMAYSPEVGIALIAASGLVAIGAGVVGYYAERNEAAETTEAAAASAATAAASRMSRNGPISISLINTSGTPLTATATETSDGAGGRMLSIEVNKALRSAVASGMLDSSMRGRYGLAAVAVRKG